MRKKYQKKEIFKLGVLLGGILGTVTGLLVAPKKGQESREDLKALSTKVKEKAQQHIPHVKKTVGKQLDTIKDKLPVMKKGIFRQASNVKNKVKEEVRNAKEALQDHLAEKQKKS